VTDTLHPKVQTYSVCSIAIAATDTVAAARHIVSNAVAGTTLQVHLCNAYTLSLVDLDPTLRMALLEADLNLADGTPVAWLGRQSGMTGPVRGTRLVGEVAAQGNGLVHHYLYGGKESVAERMADGLRRAVPGISVVGTSTPPFRPLGEDDIDGLVARVRASGANILWIGLGTRCTGSPETSRCRSSRWVRPSTTGPVRSTKRRRSCTAAAWNGCTDS
jgi:N-acetylglucosaminyldiphosphoundecaprenol N-acetyl-beta-D-mannosaminyltransferase